MRRRTKSLPFKPEDLTQDRLNQLQQLQKHLSIHFIDICLIDQAFTHRSYANEAKSPHYDNERLEFLGDSVLGLAAAEFLFSNAKTVSEGLLAKWKSKIVSGPALSAICEELKLINFVRFGKGEKDSGKSNKRVMENLIEALLGAIYLDQGFDGCKRFILPHLNKLFTELGSNESVRDYKSLLQEKSQKKFKQIPRYELVSEEGLDHDKVFQIRVTLPNGISKLGEGKNKRTAEQNAAKLVLKIWSNDP